MTRVYYKEAVGAFIVFDVTRADTFRSVDKWKTDLDTKVLLPDGRPIPCVLLGNKSDQPPSEPLYKDNEGMESFCIDKNFAGWFPVSAKDNVNVEEAAKFLVQKIIDNDKWSKHRLNARPDLTDSIDLMSYRQRAHMGLQNDKKCNC